MTTPRRELFDWLDDAPPRHGGLRMIQTAIARGWLEGPEHADRRARLVDALARLTRDPATPIRDVLQACRLLAVSMIAADLRLLDRSLPRRRKPRRRRMGMNRQREGGLPCGPTDRAGATGPTGLDREAAMGEAAVGLIVVALAA
jgi:hypothetical protein